MLVECTVHIGGACLITIPLLASLVQSFLSKAEDFSLAFLSSSVSTYRISRSQPYRVCQTWSRVSCRYKAKSEVEKAPPTPWPLPAQKCASPLQVPARNPTASPLPLLIRAEELPGGGGKKNPKKPEIPFNISRGGTEGGWLKAEISSYSEIDHCKLIAAFKNYNLARARTEYQSHLQVKACV